MSIDFEWFETEILSRKLNDKEKESLSCITIQTYNDEENIITKGQQGGMLYILRSGTAAVEDNSGDIRVRIAGVEEGTLFGEISFLGEDTATEDVLALEKCVVYKLSKEDFSMLMKDEQELAYSLLSKILASQAAIIRRLDAELLPIWRNLKKKAQQLPLIVKLIPVILIITYIGAWGYQWKTQEGKHNYQQQVHIQKQAIQETQHK